MGTSFTRAGGGLTLEGEPPKLPGESPPAAFLRRESGLRVIRPPTWNNLVSGLQTRFSQISGSNSAVSSSFPRMGELSGSLVESCGPTGGARGTTKGARDSAKGACGATKGARGAAIGACGSTKGACGRRKEVSHAGKEARTSTSWSRWIRHEQRRSYLPVRTSDGRQTLSRPAHSPRCPAEFGTDAGPHSYHGRCRPVPFMW